MSDERKRSLSPCLAVRTVYAMAETRRCTLDKHDGEHVAADGDTWFDDDPWAMADEDGAWL